MVKSVTAHVGLDVRAHDVADALHIVVGGGVDQTEQEINAAEDQNGLNGQRRQVFGSLVGYVADDQRQDDLTDRRSVSTVASLFCSGLTI